MGLGVRDRTAASRSLDGPEKRQVKPALQRPGFNDEWHHSGCHHLNIHQGVGQRYANASSYRRQCLANGELRHPHAELPRQQNLFLNGSRQNHDCIPFPLRDIPIPLSPFVQQATHSRVLCAHQSAHRILNHRDVSRSIGSRSGKRRVDLLRCLKSGAKTWRLQPLIAVFKNYLVL